MTINLNNISHPPIAPEVIQEMLPYFGKRLSRKELNTSIDEALHSLYTLVDAEKENTLLFTSSHTEAVNHVIFSAYLDITRKTGKNHFITSAVDEAPQIMAMSRLQEMGCLFEMIPVNKEGIVTPQAIAETITPRTALLTLSWANALTGVIQPIKEIASLCRERGILFHVEATNVLGKGRFSFKDIDCDFLSLSGEAIHGPPSTGVLFVRKNLVISPFILGGKEQEGLRGGSVNVPALIGLGKAAELSLAETDSFSIESSRLREVLEEGIGITPLFQHQERLPHITALDFPGVTSDALLFLLQRKNLIASQGGGNFQKISNILKASNTLSHSALSFSLSRYTKEEEILRAVKIIKEAYTQLKKASCHLETLL